MSRRSEQLKAVSEGFLQVHWNWADPSNNTPCPTETYWDAVDAVVDAFTDEDIPGDCRDLAKAADLLRVERDNFDNRAAPEEMYPEDSFWEAVKAFETALQDMDRKGRPLPPLESIAQLKQLPHITDTQIAKIWGLRDRFGNLSVQMVQSELDSPGSITQTPGAMDGQDWVDPRLARKSKNKVPSVRQAALEEKGRAARKQIKPCPESPKDLWEQKLTPAQAAKTLGMDAQEVEALFKGFEAERDTAITSGKIVPHKTQAIRELAKKGKGATAIAKEMKVDTKEVAEALQGG